MSRIGWKEDLKHFAHALVLVTKEPSQFLRLIGLTGFTFGFNLLVLFLLLGNDQLSDILHQANDSWTRSFAVSIGLFNFAISSWFVARMIIWYCVPQETFIEKYKNLRETTCSVQDSSLDCSLVQWFPRFYALLTPFCASASLLFMQQYRLALFTILAGVLAFFVTITRRRLPIIYFKAFVIIILLFSAIVFFLAFFDIELLANKVNAGMIVFWGLGNLLFGLTLLAYTIHLSIGNPNKPAKMILLIFSISLIPQALAKLVTLLGGSYRFYNLLLLLYGLLFFALLAYQLVRIISKYFATGKRLNYGSTWPTPSKKVRLSAFIIAAGLYLIFLLPLSSTPYFTLTENHQVTQLTNNMSSPYLSVSEAWSEFKHHLAKNTAPTTKTASQPLPFTIVLSQGGGLRAGYWSTAVLNQIHQRYPQFDQQTFILSGVSGGSVGNAFYLANLDQSKNQTRSSNNPADFSPAFKAMEKDHLTRVTISLLYNDLLFRFFPLTWYDDLAKDRARHLEISWERGFAERKWLEQGMRQIYHQSKRQQRWLPLWLSMGTVQETGQRIVTGPTGIESNVFPDVVDYFEMNSFDLESQQTLEDFDIPLSTAALNAARFPYVTPPGALYRQVEVTQDGESSALLVRRHILDGGYFDNFGSDFVHDWLSFLFANPEQLQLENGRRLQPIIVVIDNDLRSKSKSPEHVRERHFHASSNTWPFRETTSPLQGFLQTRPGHTVRAVEKFQSVRGICVFRFSLLSMKDETSSCADKLPNNNLEVPLGWWLSDTSEQYMKNIDQCKNHADNRTHLDKLSELLEHNQLNSEYCLE